MKTALSALRLLAALSLLTGLVYPLAVWALGHAFFHDAAEGSLVYRDGKLVGSALLAQKTTDPRYFWPRPSGGDYATVASGASNLAWTSAKLRAAIDERRTALGRDVPADLLTASGSGLDPDITSEAARFQLARIAESRHLDATQRTRLEKLVSENSAGGDLTPARVNTLRLNLALDATFGRL